MSRFRNALLLGTIFTLSLASVVFTQSPPGRNPSESVPMPVGEWTMFGGTPARNMVNLQEKFPTLPSIRPNWKNPEATKKWETKWLKWKADLGSWCYTTPVVAGGKVFIGTNNERPRNKRDRGKPNEDDPEGPPIDKSMLMCFEVKTGKFLWQAVHDKLDHRMQFDWNRAGICSTPTVVDDRVYYVSNQCRVVCLDVNGFANGNQGLQTEKYNDPTDADIIWEYDMLRELKVFPYCMANGCPLIIGDFLFTQTSHGVDENHLKVDNPDAPSFVCLNRHTGKLVWSDNSPGKNIMHGQWASPAFSAGPVPQVIFPGGDGWLRAFDPPTGKLLWKFDCNPKEATYEVGGKGRRNDFLACPVVSDVHVYIGTGQSPEHFEGQADLWSIDLTQAIELGKSVADHDVSPTLIENIEKQPNGKQKVTTKANPASAVAWHYGDVDNRNLSYREYTFGRTLSTFCVVDGVLYAPELNGYIHCLDAKTGKHFWLFDTGVAIWASPYYVDGKIIIGNEDGELYFFKHQKNQRVIDERSVEFKVQKEATSKKDLFTLVNNKVKTTFVISKIELPESMYSTPVVANGVLYIATRETLYAFGTP